MDAETIQKLQDCEGLLQQLESSASTAVVAEVQVILSRNMTIIAEIDSLRQVDKEGGAGDSKDRTVRVATLLHQLNFNLNEVVKLYQDMKITK